MFTARSLWRELTLTKTRPEFGMVTPAANWLFAKAIGNVSAIPMTSPVDRISGPRTMSTPANFRNGNTLSLTETCEGSGSEVSPSSASFEPAMTLAAMFATGTPVALATKGTVRLARGFTSSTYTFI